MKHAYILTQDIGTSSAKAILFSADGKLVRNCSASYGLVSPQKGWFEQSPEDWWHVLRKHQKNS